MQALKRVAVRCLKYLNMPQQLEVQENKHKGILKSMQRISLVLFVTIVNEEGMGHINVEFFVHDIFVN